MEINERIKKRRKELGISPEAVADALNVSCATIYRYESNEIKKLPIDTLEPLAKILKTSPAYLMGWEDIYAHLSSDAKHLVDLFYSLNIDGRDKILNYAEDIISSGRYAVDKTYMMAEPDSSVDMVAYDGNIQDNKINIIEED